MTRLRQLFSPSQIFQPLATKLTGYLPVFGPAFVNFYGTTRKFSALQSAYDEKQNEGIVEGCSYRGRALVSLTTQIGEYPKVSISAIDSDEILKVDKFLRRRRFVIHVSFMNASMISEYENPVEFEVSMGNFGNKFEDSVMPSPSTTQPTNPVFDGSGYYFLPWNESKPEVAVTCQWEDIGFRIKSLNKLLNMSRRLKNGIRQLEDALKAGKTTQDLAVQFLAVIDRLLADCENDLPEPEVGVHVPNPLDGLMKNRRKAELKRLSKQAFELRTHATDINEVIKELENYSATLDSIAIEPQNSLPDVIIWMLSGDKRIAYHRVAAHDIFYAADEEHSGAFCAKTMAFELKYPEGDDSNMRTEIPGLLRVKMWFGLQADEAHWFEQNPNTEVSVFAETYENQNLVLTDLRNQMKLKSWGTKGLLRPNWSDVSGMYSLPKGFFEEPENWKFSGDWFVNPEPSMGYDMDAGHRKFLEDVFENENRIPGGKWVKPLTAWTDVRGDPKAPRDDIQCPSGWIWSEDDWEVDRNRGVDEDGWEYAVEPSLGGYSSVEKVYHVFRRRRWVRQRVVDPNSKAESRGPTINEEGWEYAPLFNLRFHGHERKIDVVRRRRWHRKLVAEDPTAKPPHFNVLDEGGSDGIQALAIPRMFLTFKESHTYQLRAYMYQARDLLAGDRSGFSDPYASVCFLNQSQRTEKISSTLSPTWDQTLIFDEIPIVGSTEHIFQQPPVVVVELFDNDEYGKPEFLGRAKITPTVDLNPEGGKAPKLAWHTITRFSDENGGELLAAFHLMLKDDQDLPFFPPQRGSLFIVPNGIRPVLQRTAVEVLCWGLRNMDTYDLMPVKSPSIEFEIGDTVVTSTVIPNLLKSPNFPEPALIFDIMLPREDLYMPPLNIKVRDHRSFGSKPIVGRTILKSLEGFRVEPRSFSGDEDLMVVPSVNNGGNLALMDFETSMIDGTDSTRSTAKLLSGDTSTIITIEPSLEELAKVKSKASKRNFCRNINLHASQEKEIHVAVDWWSKYYASVGEKKMSGKYTEQGYEKLDFFSSELEEVPRYKKFEDFLSSIQLRKCKPKNPKALGKVVGEFKGTFKVYPLPGDRNEALPPKYLEALPSSNVEEAIVRVYIVRARDLVPMDPTTRLADPYVTVMCGKKKHSSKKEYRPNTLNPIFGQCFVDAIVSKTFSMFELTAEIPTKKDLVIQVWDHDAIGSDDLIGETTIDLENRCLTKYRATCGLPKLYHISGPNQWRDSNKPREILERMAMMWHYGKPIWKGARSVTVGNKSYSLDDFEPVGAKLPPSVGSEAERLALYVLHSGLNLVGEHVETRSLHRSNLPGLEQGKLELFVDIFPKSMGSPGPSLSIEPRIPTKYILRAVIWNTKDVVMQETSVVTGESMSDIFVKAFLQGRIQESQKTDIHYRSMDGEGQFNWRMVFSFDYLEAEQVIVHKESKGLWKDSRELKVPPRLVLQIWDDDKFSRDDQLGEIILDLNMLIPPAKSQAKCGLEQLPGVNSSIDDAENGDTTAVSKFINLFQAKRLSGFWPVTYKNKDGVTEVTGKLEMELEILTEVESSERPAGLGRHEPNVNPKLEPPKYASRHVLLLAYFAMEIFQAYCLEAQQMGDHYLFRSRHSRYFRHIIHLQLPGSFGPPTRLDESEEATANKFLSLLLDVMKDGTLYFSRMPSKVIT
ncbi:unnamed protein product [Notodromas monacha]|uniref:C2 domain-containing protein n=1 Tax=Notodromas monacha TaxID=399045 RepID=A0A7R9BE95_9CRUS|nr:unnamed protein product [Notodromas monacha]CAG0913749.1 unnamed protein product [Notodromas monacha]